MSIQVERQIRKMAADNSIEDAAFMVYLHPEVAEYLIGGAAVNIDLVEEETHKAIYVRANPQMHMETYEIIPGDIAEIERQMLPYRKSQVIECDVVKNPFIDAPRASAWADGYQVDLANGVKFIGQRVRARLTLVGRSFSEGEVLGAVRGQD